MGDIRVGDRKEKFLVARMTERQKKIAQFKAHKTGYSIDELVIEAVDQFDVMTGMKNVTCLICEEKKVITDEPFSYPYNGKEVKVVNYLQGKCACPDDKSDFYAENYLEDIVKFELKQIEKEGREIPDEIDLVELLQMR